MATAGSIVVDLIMRTGMFETDTKRAEKRLRDMQKTAERAGKVIGTAIAAGVGIAVGALTVLTKNAIDQADAMRDMSIRLGESTETLSAYGYAASQTGTDIETLGKGLKILSKNAADALNPTSEQAKVFDALGIKVTDATGKLKSLSELVPQIADKFKVLEDGTTKAALAQALFGKAGLDLTEFLNQGGQGLDDFAKKAADLGIIIDTQTATAADDFNDTLGDLKAQASGLGLDIARELLPVLKDSATDLRDLIKQGNLASDIAAVIGAAFSAAGALLSGYDKTVRLVTLAMENATVVAQSWYEIQKNILTLGFAEGSVSGGLDRIRAQKAASDRERAQIMGGNAPAKPKLVFAGEGPDPAGLFKMSAGEVEAKKQAAELEAALAKALSNPTAPSGGKKSAGGMSDADRAAEQLQQSYDRIVASLKEQIALTGDASDMAKLRYDLENGELAKLDPMKKQQLLGLQQEADFRREDTEALKEAIRVEEEHRKAVEEGIKSTDALINDMQFELALLGMTNEERARAIALRYADVNATDAQRQKIVELSDALGQAHENEQIIDGLKDSMKGFIVEGASGAETLGDAWDNMFDRIRQRALEFVADKIINQFFDMLSGGGSSGTSSSVMNPITGAMMSSGGGSSGGGFWSSLISGLFGGSRAGGGDVMANRSYLVGENGPERFVPRTAGAIIPAHAVAGGSSGGGDFTFAPTFLLPQRVDSRTQQQISQRTGDAAREAMRRNSGR